MIAALDQPAYRPLWLAARRRLEGNGRSLSGTPLTLRGLSRAESDAVAGLLGVRRPSAGSPMRVTLAALDQALRTSSVGQGLQEVLERLGGPVIDRRAGQATAEASTAADWAALATHPAAAADDRLRDWLEHVRRAGLPRRLAGDHGVTSLRSALDVLAAVRPDVSDLSSEPALSGARHRLAALAAAVAGDAHALDRGRPVGTLTVHALNWLRGLPFPRDAADWRGAWAEAGVACDDLSCDVLVLNLPGFAKEPLRLTLRQVVAWRAPPGSTGPVALACENPAVVAAIADRFATAAPPIICTDGMPSTAVLMVLDRLAAASYRISYHGDFDWRGLTIAGVVARKIPGATAWKYGAFEYERAIEAGRGSIELAGRSAVSPWDPDLAPAMTRAGHAVYEEQVLDDLLDSVAGMV